jgi:ribokinase
MKNLFVVGSLHLDVIVKSPRIPQKDETIIGKSVEYVFGGKGGNQALAADQNGANTYFAGRVGSDSFAKLLTTHLQHSSVDFSGLQVGAGASGMSVAIVETSGEYSAAVVSGENLHIDEKSIKLPKNTGVLLLQNEINDKVNLELAKRAKATGSKIWLNAAPAKRIDTKLLSLIDLCIVNRVEAEFYEFSNKEKIQNNLTIIKTLGQQGLELIEPGGNTKKIPAFNVNVVSSHGAGDMFIGALAARYLEGNPIESALEYAQGAAALHISRPENERKEITPKKISDFITSNFKS